MTSAVFLCRVRSAEVQFRSSSVASANRASVRRLKPVSVIGEVQLDKIALQALRSQIEELSSWSAQAIEVDAAFRQVNSEADAAGAAIRNRMSSVEVRGALLGTALPLGPIDASRLAALRRRINLADLSEVFSPGVAA